MSRALHVGPGPVASPQEPSRRPSGPNALLVYPKIPPSFWGAKYLFDVVGIRANMPPLGLLTVAAMFPDRYSLKVVDMNVEDLTDSHLAWADVVFTSTMTVQQESLREVIGRCNRRHLTIVAGGPHPTSFHDQIPGVDHFILGEVEDIFSAFLDDLENGRAERVYNAPRPAVTKAPIPRFDLVDLQAYLCMALQFSRGCPFDCEFCDITKLFGRIPRTKGNDQMIAEFDRVYELGWRGLCFLVDDNFIGNKRDALRLLPAIASWQKERSYPFSLRTEATINLVEIPQLMDSMVDAGFSSVFIGIESPNPETLKKTKKGQNTKRGVDDYLLNSIRTLHRKGLEVSGGFILGLDGDGAEVFDAQVEFIQQAGIPMAMVGLLTALRGTNLYNRLETEGRLLKESTGNNVGTDLNFIPELDRRTLVEGYRRVLMTLYDPNLKNYFRRCLTMFKELDPPRHVHRQGSKVGKKELRAFGRLIRRHLTSRHAGRYLLFLAETLLTKPRMLQRAIRLAGMGYHFEKLTSQIVAVDEFRRTLRTAYRGLEEALTGDCQGNGSPGSTIRRDTERAIRNVRSSHRRIHAGFRHLVETEWRWFSQFAEYCAANPECVRKYFRDAPTFEALFRNITLESYATQRGLRMRPLGEILQDTGSAAARKRLRSITVTPSAGHLGLVRSLEMFFQEIDVEVIDGLESGGDHGTDAMATLDRYLRSAGGTVDCVVVPLSGSGTSGLEPKRPVLIEPDGADPGLPTVLVIPFNGGALHEDLGRIGTFFTDDLQAADMTYRRTVGLMSDLVQP